MRHVKTVLGAAFSMLFTMSVPAQTPHGEPACETAALPQALLPDIESFTLTGEANHARYRVWLYRPRAVSGSAESSRAKGELSRPAAQDEAPPLLVLLDGNATFALAVGAARLQERVIGPVVIAAIAADNDALFDEPQRFRDFTTPSRDGWGIPRNAQGTPLTTGGAEAFESVINESLPRAIAARVRVSSTKRMLFGHSLGGFLVLHDALAHPAAYSRYMAASPSLWWSGGELLAQLQTAAIHGREEARDDARRAVIPLAIRVGGDEQRIAPGASPARVERVEHAAMIDNAHAFADAIREAPGPGFDVDLQIYPGQNHVSYLPGAIGEAVLLASKAVATPRDATHVSANPGKP